ncbi:MAG: hypothetical protein ACC682_13225 [Gemmatimonadota bacterium]
MNIPTVLDRPALRSAVPYAALVLVAAAYLWEVLSLAGVPVARDMQMFFIPQKHILWAALTEGRVPLWTPFIGTGAPFLANVQSGVFYPPHWLYAVLPFYAAFNLLVVFHFVLGGVFAFLLCRRLGMRPAAAYVAAAVWMLGGYFASLLNLVNALQGAAWAPGLAWAVVRMPDVRAARGVAVLVVVATCALLAGEPQSFVFSAGTAVVTGALMIARHPLERVDLARLLGWLAIAGVIVAGLTAIQLLPTFELLHESGRAGGLSYPQAVAYDLKPIRLVHFLIPPDYRDPEYAFGVRSVIGRGDPWLFSIYLGALTPIFTYFAWRRRDRRREVAVWSAIALFAVVVALGESTPLYQWLFDHVPGFAAFRFPEKYLFWTAFSAMLITGWGAEDLLDARARRGDRWWGIAYLTAVIGAVVLFRVGRVALERYASGWGNDRMMSDFGYAYGIWMQNVLKLAVFVSLALGLIWLFRRRRVTTPVFAVLISTLVTVDLAIAHRGLNPVVEQAFYEREPLLFEHLPIEDVRRDYRLRTTRFDSAVSVPVIRGIPLEAQKWMWQQILAPNVGQTWSVLQQDAWDAIKLSGARDELQLQRAIPDARRRWALLRLHSVKYVHSILGVDAAGEAREIELDTLPGTLYELERPLPRAYVVSRAETYATSVEVVNRMLSSDFEVRDAVTLLDSTRASDPVPEPRASELPTSFPRARISSATDAEVRVQVHDVTAGAYLVLTDSHYPGWVARVDGVERPIEQANLFFRAVALQPGDREVTFSYRSRPFERGRAISLVTLLLALTGFTVLELRSRTVEREG